MPCVTHPVGCVWGIPPCNNLEVPEDLPGPQAPCLGLYLSHIKAVVRRAVPVISVLHVAFSAFAPSKAL